MIEFVVEGDPVAKGRPRFTVIGGRARAYTPQTTADAERAIATCAQRHLKAPLLGALRVEVTTFHRMPKSLSKARRIDALHGTLRPGTRPDADNLGKLVLDALNGIAYEDDNQVVELLVQKFYGIVPRTIVKVCRV